MAKGGKGGNALALLLLLGLLGGGAGWNYQRNLALEDAEVRPFETLSDADLATLLAATEAEAKKLGARYDEARERRASVEVTGVHTAERLRDFERVQAHGRAVRDMGQRTSQVEASLAELQKETQRRAGQGDGLQVFLRRAFTLP